MVEDEDEATLATWTGLIWNAPLLDELENLCHPYGQPYRPHKVISAIVWKQLLITCGFGLKGLRRLRPLETVKSPEAMFADYRTFFWRQRRAPKPCLQTTGLSSGDSEELWSHVCRPPDCPSRSLAVIFVFSFNLGILLVLHLSSSMGWGIRGEDYCSDPSCILQIFYPCHSPSTYWELTFGNSESRPSFLPFTATGLLPG